MKAYTRDFVRTRDQYEYWKGLFVNEHAPIGKKCDKKTFPILDKNGKGMKRKHAKISAKDHTTEILELKKKYQNITPRQRRKAIREYWYSMAEEHKSRPDKSTTHLSLLSVIKAKIQ